VVPIKSCLNGDRTLTDHPGVPVHGEQEWAWPVLCWTLDTDHGFRVGFEDVLTGPDGGQVSGNADLLAAALELRRTTA
jgi:uncharacterized protein (DUF849 family)